MGRFMYPNTTEKLEKIKKHIPPTAHIAYGGIIVNSGFDLSWRLSLKERISLRKPPQAIWAKRWQ